LTAALLIPGVMKFFSNVAAIHPQKIFNNYPQLIDLLFECLMNDDDLSLIYTGLDTFGSLSKFEDGKKLLDSNYGDKCSQVVAHIFMNIALYPADVKPRALLSLENAFWIDDDEQMINNQILYICQKWNQSIFPSNNYTQLLTFCQTPFNEIALSAFGFLRALVKFPFGQKAVKNTGGLIEYLLDRNSIISHDVRQIKYDIVEVLARSNEFDGNTIQKFNTYVREGVHFVAPESEVAFESAD
jgi:hypothetical protein